MSQAVGDLIVNLDLNDAKFTERYNYVKRGWKGSGLRQTMRHWKCKALYPAGAVCEKSGNFDWSVQCRHAQPARAVY
jgi:hypothetical protein